MLKLEEQQFLGEASCALSEVWHAIRNCDLLYTGFSLSTSLKHDVTESIQCSLSYLLVGKKILTSVNAQNNYFQRRLDSANAVYRNSLLDSIILFFRSLPNQTGH